MQIQDLRVAETHHDCAMVNDEFWIVSQLKAENMQIDVYKKERERERNLCIILTSIDTCVYISI